MPNVREIAEEIVAREGGFVTDPDDPGGATNHGVTIGTLRRLGIDVNRDTRIDVADVKALSQKQAVDIYLKHYFEAPGIGALPEAVQAHFGSATPMNGFAVARRSPNGVSVW